MRKLRRFPAFTLTSILVLAIGIGATSAIFSVVYGVLIQPLPYSEPGRLITLTHRSENTNQARLPASTAIYFTYRDNNRSFDSVALWASDNATITGVGSPEEVRALVSTYEFLPMLGVNLESGRLFASSDDQPSSLRTVIVSHGYWQRRFGGTGILGRRLTVNGAPHEIIGVLPQSFRFFQQQIDIVLPLRPNRAVSFVGPLAENGLARLRPGVTIATASSDVERMIPILASTFPPVPGMDITRLQNLRLHPDLQYLKDAIVGDLRSVLWVMMGTLAILLLMACTNVATLQLVRTESRSHELAIQAALGASRSRIALELIAESTVVALIGGALGLALSSASLPMLLRMAGDQLPGALEIRVGWPVILFSSAVAVASGLLLGFAAALRYRQPVFAAALAASGRSQSMSRESHRIRSAMSVAQVALALVLLLAAALMIRTFQSLTTVDAGFDASPTIQTIAISISEGLTPDFQAAIRKFNEMQDRLAAITEVESVGFASRVPLADGGPSAGFFVENKTYPGNAPAQREFRYVSPDFFETIGAPVVAGRDFTRKDDRQSRRVAMVSEGMARREWGSASAALGRRIRMTPAEPWGEIVGVVGDIRHESLSEPAPDSVYLTIGEPLAQYMSRTVTFVIRSPRVGKAGFLEELQKSVWSVDADLPVANVQTMATYYGRAMERTSLTLVLLGAAATMALVLGLVGIYGVISYTVSLRGREIGIRLALGAQVAGVRRMLMRHVLALVLVGLAVGLSAAVMLASLMESLVFGVTPYDPVTYAGVCAILIFTALCAGYLPTRRIARIDSVLALRAE